MASTESSQQTNYYVKLIELANGYMKSRVLLTAIELNLFELIGNRTISSEMIAEQLDTDHTTIDVMLNALAGLGLINKINDQYSNIKEIAQLLTPGSPNYQGDTFLHYNELWEAWSNLTRVISAGEKYKTKGTIDADLGFAKELKQQAKRFAPRIVKLVDCQSFNTMLDIGGGLGAYCIEFAKSYPHLKSVLFEKNQHLLNVAEKEIAGLNLHERITLTQGDFLYDDFGNGFGLALLASIICRLGEDEIVSLLAKTFASLSQNGKIILIDMFLDESKTQPLASAIYSVNMLIHSSTGRLYTFSEINNMLKKAGFVDVYKIPMGHFIATVGIKDPGVERLR